MIDLREPALELIRHFGEQHVVAFFLVLARLTPLFLLAPLFSSRMVSARVRGIVAVALAVGIAPVVMQGQTLPLDALGIGELVVKELLVGLAFAFALGALMAALTVAGTFLDYMIGYSFSGLVDPDNGVQATVLNRLYGLFAVLIFIAINGDHWVIQGIARTYDLVSLSEMPALGPMVAGATDVFVTIFASAVQIAGPVMLALVLTDAAFGVISRVMPQLNVFMVGFPAKVVFGLLIIGTTLPFVGGWFVDELQTSVAQALRTLRVA
jgi:flagellar biosynthetic protein FliR